MEEMMKEICSVDEIGEGTMEDMEQTAEGNAPDSGFGKGGRMFVLGNEKKLFGAAAMFYRDTIEEFSDEMGKSIFILPSSVHEVILVPDDGLQEPEELWKMVCEINETQVEPEDVLTDSVYYFSRKCKKIKKLRKYPCWKDARGILLGIPIEAFLCHAPHLQMAVIYKNGCTVQFLLRYMAVKYKSHIQKQDMGNLAQQLLIPRVTDRLKYDLLLHLLIIQEKTHIDAGLRLAFLIDPAHFIHHFFLCAGVLSETAFAVSCRNTSHA